MQGLRELLSFSWGRVEMSLRQRGIRGTMERSLYYAWLYLTPAGINERRFDSRFGVNTSGVMSMHELGVKTPNVMHATEYSTTPIREFMRISKRLRIHHPEWVFVDIGAGKGKVMLLACHFPFKKVIGVEFAPDLARIAEENIASYDHPGRRCQQVSVVQMDATAYSLPPEKSILFLNNPFRGPVLQRVIENIERSLQSHPRDLYVIYWNPFCRELFDRSPFLVRTRKAAQYSVYRSRIPARTGDLPVDVMAYQSFP
jgi:precorrin-6B methylase 2